MANNVKANSHFESDQSEAGVVAAGTKPVVESLGNVLVADDSEMICDIVSMGLTSAGYKVTAVRSGEEALQIFRKTPNEFPVVIVDDYMPGGMTGHEVVYHVRTVAPKTKVILTSGYFLSNGQADFEEEAVSRLEKPFRIDHLVKLVKEALG